jgi:drug/metabolite transporter (DMT)-like permease
MFKAVCYGILSSLFFSVTFILNREMSLNAGSWEWSAALRFIFMLPLLFIILLPKQSFMLPLKKVKQNPFIWLLWSTVGFGLFYAPLCYAASFAPAWLIASSWQLTIPIGVLLTPVFATKVLGKSFVQKVFATISWKILSLSCIIVFGVILLLYPEFHLNNDGIIIAILWILVGTIAYPLGNRKIMLGTGSDLTTFQRMFGMCVASMPFWVVIVSIAMLQGKFPSNSQLMQSGIIAVCSGIIATWLLFEAASMVRTNLHQIAVIESTQAGEVIFTLLGGILFFNDSMPTLISWCGIALIIGGMLLNSFYANKLQK